MTKSDGPVVDSVSAEAATLTLKNLRLTDSILIDEVTLQGSSICVSNFSSAAPPTVTAEETLVRAMMTEANVNRMLAANTPVGAPVKNLKLVLFTGRAQLKGQYIKSVMSLPFTLDAKPVIHNGIRVSLDCSASHVGAIELPSAIVDVLERVLNEKLTFDLSESPVPVRLDEIRCEPGRLTIIGRARLTWPLPVTTPASALIGAGSAGAL